MAIPDDPKRFAINAICAADSAEILFLCGTATVGRSNPIAGPSFIGGTILGSFGIEMLLKSIHCLLNVDNSFPYGHDLDTLFNNIPDDTMKTELSTQFNAETGLNLDDFMSAHKTAFEDWRYFGEKDNNLNFDPGACRKLAAILKIHVRDLLPE